MPNPAGGKANQPSFFSWNGSALRAQSQIYGRSFNLAEKQLSFRRSPVATAAPWPGRGSWQEEELCGASKTIPATYPPPFFCPRKNTREDKKLFFKVPLDGKRWHLILPPLDDNRREAIERSAICVDKETLSAEDCVACLVSSSSSSSVPRRFFSPLPHCQSSRTEELRLSRGNGISPLQVEDCCFFAPPKNKEWASPVEYWHVSCVLLREIIEHPKIVLKGNSSSYYPQFPHFRTVYID